MSPRAKHPPRFGAIVSALSLIVIIILVSACSGSASRVEPVRFLVGVSQANLSEPWRIVMVDEIRAAAARHPDLRVLFTDASDSPHKQISDVSSLLEYGIDLLIISPAEAKALTPVVQNAYKRIPVIILDRAVEGYDYTLYIGPDNESIGRRAGSYISELLEKTGGTVLPINGVRGSPPTVGRQAGFQEVIAAHPNIKVLDAIQGNWLRDRTEEEVLKRIGNYGHIDVIFAQNDAMAYGAKLALRLAGRDNIRIIGVDGLSGPLGGLDLVANHQLDATFTCPTGGREAIDFAVDILNHRVGIPKKVILRTQTVVANELLDGSLHKPVPIRSPSARASQKIVLGFAQVGSESDWRVANTHSIIDAAAASGIELRFVDGQASEAIQKKAIRQFIKDKVDVIAFSPRVEYGWEEVLSEAKAAGIPVILTDRTVSLKDDSLWVTFMGSDFVEEGRRAARWLLDKSQNSSSVNIVELQGTPGSAPAIDRGIGFREVLGSHPQYHIIASENGDFTFEGGKAAMKKIIQEHGPSIQMVFAHNDDMALGAIEAIEAAGYQPGIDIRIVSIDAVHKAFEAMKAGKLNCTVECSPLLGPLLMKAVLDYMSGIDLPSRIITSEGVFPAETAADEIDKRQY